MKIIVTGGAGMIGGFVVAELARAGHEIVVIDQRRPIRLRVCITASAITKTWARLYRCALARMPSRTFPRSLHPVPSLATSMRATSRWPSD